MINLGTKLGTVALSSLVVLSLGLFNSGLAQEESDAAADAPKLEITLGDFFFQLAGQDKNAPITVKAGETYNLVLKNTGTQKHEIQWGRDPKMENGMPHDYSQLLFTRGEAVMSDAGHEFVSPGLTEIVLEPNAEATALVTIPEEAKGTWEMGCFQPSHYQAGMHLTFNVQ